MLQKLASSTQKPERYRIRGVKVAHDLVRRMKDGGQESFIGQVVEVRGELILEVQAQSRDELKISEL